jgi:DNA gyrase subunit A
MARKAKETKKRPQMTDAYIESAGLVLDQRITETLTENYMPYAMSVSFPSNPRD